MFIYIRMYTTMIIYLIKLILILVFNTCVNIYYINSGCKCCCCGQPKTPELITSNNKKIPTKQKDNITKQLNINDKKEEINKINNKDKNSIEENDKGKDKDNKEENNIKENYKNKDKDKNKSKKEIKQKEVINKIDKEEGEKIYKDKDDIEEKNIKENDKDKYKSNKEFKEEKRIKEKIKPKEEIDKIKKKEGIKEEKKGKDDDEEENYEEDGENNEEDDEKNEEKNTENKENNNKEELKTHFENILICLNILYHDENFVHYIIEKSGVFNIEHIKDEFKKSFASWDMVGSWDMDIIFKCIEWKSNEAAIGELNRKLHYLNVDYLKERISFFENIVDGIAKLVAQKLLDSSKLYKDIKDNFSTIEYQQNIDILDKGECLRRVVVTIANIEESEVKYPLLDIKEIDVEKLKEFIENIKENIIIINTKIINYLEKLKLRAQEILEISEECEYFVNYCVAGLSDEDINQIKKSIEILEECIKSEDLICSIKENKTIILDELFKNIRKNIEGIYLKYLYVIYIDDFIHINIPEEKYKPTLTKDYRSSFIFSFEEDNYEDFVKDTEEEFTNIKNLKFFKTLKKYENDAPLAIFNRSNIEFKDLEINIYNLKLILMICLNEINGLKVSLAKEIPLNFPNLEKDCKKILKQICSLSFIGKINYLKNDNEYKKFKENLKNNLYTENILEKYKTICENLKNIISTRIYMNDQFNPVDYFEGINNKLKKYIEEDKKNSDKKLKIFNNIVSFIEFRKGFIEKLKELRKILLNEILYDLYVISNCLDYIVDKDKNKTNLPKIVDFMEQFKKKDFEIKIIDNNIIDGNMEEINKILEKIIKEKLFIGEYGKQMNEFLIKNNNKHNRISEDKNK